MKHACRPLLFCLLLLPLFIGCSDQDDTFELPLQQNEHAAIVAQVGDQIIFVSDVDAELQHMPAALQHLANSPEARKRVEDILIRRAVLSQQAVAQGVDLKPDVFARIRKSRDNILIDALKNQYLSNLSLPTESALQRYYDGHKADFTMLEQIHAAHILLRTKKEADALYATLQQDPEQFSVMAMKLSMDDSNSSRGGDLNWFPRGIMAEAFEKVAFALKKEGSISKPVQSNSGWHIIQLKGRKASSMQPFSEAKKEIIHILQHQAVEDWIALLVHDANIRRVKKSNTNSISIPEGLPPLENHAKKSTHHIDFSETSGKNTGASTTE